MYSPKSHKSLTHTLVAQSQNAACSPVCMCVRQGQRKSVLKNWEEMEKEKKMNEINLKLRWFYLDIFLGSAQDNWPS